MKHIAYEIVIAVEIHVLTAIIIIIENISKLKAIKQPECK